MQKTNRRKASDNLQCYMSFTDLALTQQSYLSKLMSET